jgi:hypothetical protein
VNPRGDAASDVITRRVAALRSQVQSLDAQINQLQQRMPPVEAEMDRLTREIGSLKAPETEDEKEEPEPQNSEPRKVQYRPPLLRVVKKDTPLAIVCQNKRILILDLDEQDAAFKKIADDDAALQRFINAGGGKLPAGDFEIVVTITRITGGALISQKAIPRTDQSGDSSETALQPTARLQRRLASLDPEKNVLQFVVYPDSFDAFRTVRKPLWERGFSVNWLPLEHGDPINVGGGDVRAQ